MHIDSSYDAARRLGSADEVRKHLEAEWRRPIGDHDWWFLCRHFDDTLDALVGHAPNEAGFQDAAEYARTVVSHLAGRRQSQDSTAVARREDATPRASGMNRSLAVSAMCALHARARPDVVQFRRDALGDSLVAADQVPVWIQKQVEEEPYPPVASRPLVAGRRRRFRPLLSYPSPSGWAECIPVGEGTLGWLSDLAETLVDTYGWSEPNAVGFVLTDQIPRVGMRSATHIECKWTVTLTIPYWTSGADVEAAYLRGRRELLDTGLPELRPMNENSAALVLFVVQTLDTNGQPRQGWPRVWQEWNERHPQWRYSDWQALNSRYRRLEKTVWPSPAGNTDVGPRLDSLEKLLGPVQ